MRYVLAGIGWFVRNDDGQDLIEYGLLAALIALVAVAGVTQLGNTIYNTFWRAIAQSF